MSRTATNGEFIKSPRDVGGPSARVHPLVMVEEAMELSEVVTSTTEEEERIMEQEQETKAGAADSDSKSGHSMTRTGTETFDIHNAGTTSAHRGSFPTTVSTSPALGSHRAFSMPQVRTRGLAAGSDDDSDASSNRNWDSSKSKRSPRKSSLLALAKKKSLLAMKKKLARTRTRDRTLDDRVDQIEQSLAKYMYQTLGLKAAFEFYNKDGNAGLDREELAEILLKCNAEYHEAEFEALMDRYDADGNGTITLSEFTTTVPISRPRLVEYLIIKDEQRAACLGLPVTVLFFIWFVLLLSLHDVTGSAYAVESGVMDDLLGATSSSTGDSFYKVETVDGLWDWLGTVLVPLAFVQTVPGTDGRVAPPYEWGTINNYNHLLGAGVSIQQTRSGTDGCPVAMVDIALNASCHPWQMPFLDSDSQNWTSDSTFGLPLCSTLSAEYSCVHGVNCSSFYSSEHCYDDVSSPLSDYVASTNSGFSVVPEENRAIEPYPVVNPTLPAFEVLLDAAQPQEEILAQIDYLRGREWVDESTKHVQLLFATFNGEYGTYMAVNLMWEINRGGKVIPSIKLQDSVPADPYFNNNGWIWLVDVAWVIMVLAQGAGEVGEMRERGFLYWKDFWNVLDWLQIILTLGLMVLWYDICFNGLFPLSDLWLETYNSSDVFVRQEPTSMLLLILNGARDYRTGVVINIMIILVRFFKAFLVQPRLSIVTHTFVRSFVDVLHFMVILACLLFAFVFTGIYLLGHKIHDFSDVGDSLMKLYQAMLAPPLLKWDEVKVAAEAADGYSMAVTWYVLFLFIICLVFKSMLLAIIMTAYAEARNTAGPKARTMWAQLADVIIEARAASRGALQLSQVIEFLREPEEDEKADHEDVSKLYNRDTVNILDILDLYNSPGVIREGTPSEMTYRRNYARDYMLSIVAEYFDFIELKDPSEQENKQREAFQRISELDSDFKDIEKRVERVSLDMTNNFSRIFDILEKIQGGPGSIPRGGTRTEAMRRPAAIARGDSSPSAPPRRKIGSYVSFSDVAGAVAEGDDEDADADGITNV